MNEAALAIITQFYAQIDIFLLILVRVLAFFLLIPVVSGMNIPRTVRITLALCFSAALFMSGIITEVSYTPTVIGYVMLLLQEFFTGMFMGYIIFFVFNIIYYTGQLIDYQIGLSMMSVLDPITQIQVPIVGNLYYLAVSALLVASNGLNAFFGAFFNSYRLLPIGTAHTFGNGALAWYAVTLLTEFIVLAFQIAMPIVGTILVIDAALGIMVKAAPQVNIFVVGMPIKLLVGLIMLLLVMGPTLGTIYEYLFDAAYNAVTNVIRMMQ
ncbi:MAG: flagellar biosynthetic protein FliR [Clostridiales bacterium]|jgi:flagellar biosynthetic protein FliR|nr:flagellar biosynthetic protein FliR [Clostridiales bacterium]